MPSERPPKVFISYSHDSDEHEDRVLALADRLSNDGIDVALDQYVSPPPANWPRWMETEMESSDFIVVACSANYLAKVQGKVKKGEGKGVKWESLLSYQQIYDNDSDSVKFIPVLLEGGEYEHIPTPMRGGNHYRLSDDKEYEKLLRHITNQPETPKLKPGSAKKLPPRPRPGTKALTNSKPWNVPHPRNDAFTGREQILSDLHADLVKKGKQALSGLGGVGKTQIAVEYAYRHKDEYTAVLWAFADTEQSMRGGFARIAALLNLPEKDAAEQAKVTEAVLCWLEENPGWLLVLDNADDPALMKDFLPQQGKGHVLVTSRAHQFQKLGIFSPREVDVLSPKEAREFLLLRTGIDAIKKSPEADALAQELAYLPLALEQAAAYMVEKGASFASYLAGFKKQRQTLLNLQGPVLGNEAKEQQKRTVATTWAVNFADVEKNFPASADLLRLSAFLAPDAIPLELFEKGAKEMPEKLAAKLAEVADNPLALDELLSPLLHFSLIRRNDEKRTYSIHPLVQEVVRDGLSPKQSKTWVERAIRATNSVFPRQSFENWKACERFLPQAVACANWMNSFTIEFEEAALLLNKAGSYLDDRAEYVQAEPLLKHSLEILKKTVGPEHANTGIGLNDLALLYLHLDRKDEAEAMFRRALEIQEVASGPEHPTFATTLNNLARLHEKQGKYLEAESLHRRALAIFEKALGPDDPLTATSMNNLALVYRALQRDKDAELLYRKALEIDERALGAKHPDTAIDLFNLAFLLKDQGKHAEAEPLLWQALKINENALGPEHPRTIAFRNKLVQFFREQGRNPEAKALEKGVKGKEK